MMDGGMPKTCDAEFKARAVENDRGTHHRAEPGARACV